MKTRLICAGLRIRLTSKEHAMVAAEFEGWSRAETDPEKDARLASLGRLSRHICAAAEREEAEKAKRPARKRRRDPKAHADADHVGRDARGHRRALASSSTPGARLRRQSVATMMAVADV